MTDQSRALVHAITGPIILITVGSLFALDRFSGYPFDRTWPVLIIVIGMLKLFGGGSRRRRLAFQAAQAASFQAANPHFPQAAPATPATPPQSSAGLPYQGEPATPPYDPMASPPPRPGVRQ